jgi:hypothetical protein
VRSGSLHRDGRSPSGPSTPFNQDRGHDDGVAASGTSPPARLPIRIGQFN